MTALDEHEEIMRAALATWALLTKVGYRAEDIYFVANVGALPEGTKIEESDAVRWPHASSCEVLIDVRMPGRKYFHFRIGAAEYSPDVAFAKWTKIGDAWRSGAITDAEMDRYLDASIARAVVTQGILRATMDGLGPPNPSRADE